MLFLPLLLLLLLPFRDALLFRSSTTLQRHSVQVTFTAQDPVLLQRIVPESIKISTSQLQTNQIFTYSFTNSSKDGLLQELTFSVVPK